jgi:hypothetical protein
MRIKNSSIYLTFTGFLLSLCFGSVITAQAQEEKTIVSDNEHLISYKIEGDSVVFTMEGINDFTDDRGAFPDYFSIHVDVNRNGLIDSKVDIAYTVVSSDAAVCAQYLLGRLMSTVCGAFKSGASLKKTFGGSPKQKKAHPIFRLTIPKKELNKSGNKAALVFTCFGNVDLGPTIYPKEAGSGEVWGFESFAKTITIDL